MHQTLPRPQARALRAALPAAVILLSLIAAPSALRAAGALQYPPTERQEVVDDYFGTKVADPYRWLEASEDPKVQAWVDRQNALTTEYVAASGFRDAIKARLTELADYPKHGIPYERNGFFFSAHNSGLQNQFVHYVQKGLDGKARVLLDPNTLRADGTGSIDAFSLSRDARYLAYGVSWSGSDWQELYVRDVKTGKDLKDHIQHIKFTEPSWTTDGKGFFYSRQPAPGSVPAGDEHYYQKLYYHVLGQDPAKDRLLYERPDMKEAGFGPEVTEDGRYLVVQVWKGSAPETEILYMPLDGKTWELKPLRTGFDAAYEFLGAVGERFYLKTDRDAPRNRIVAVDPGRPEPENWTVVVPETRDVIEGAMMTNGKLAVSTLHNAHNLLHIYELDGTLFDQVELPTVGTVGFMSGLPGSEHFFFTFTSFVFPSTVYRYDFAARTVVEHGAPGIAVDRDAYVTRQVWCESKDGTKIPIFLAHRKDLCLDGTNPVLLYGYGGFNVTYTPTFSTSRLFWLENGGVYALAGLRGGGEFGEEWHSAGKLEKKQNVFDDYIAASEYLIDMGYTSPERLAIQGGSNGGLLTAAVELQRPELFGAVLVQVPVADMLRYHLFTVARFWIPEYGSSEDPEQFKFLHAYSPLHNVKPGTAYPATLITTADTDDRVHPGQAKKYAATLQAANASDKPILLRVETRAGHGGGKPISKQIEEQADIFSFLFRELGISPRYGAK